MMAEQRWRSWIELGTVGFLQGTVLWMAQGHWPKEIAAQTPWVTLVVATIVFGLCFELAWTGRHRLRLLLLSVLTAALFALLARWVWGQDMVGDSSDAFRIASFLLAGPATLYVFGPYLQCLQEQGNLRITYDRLFAHSWNNFFIAALAAFFVGVFWGLLSLWAALFAMIKIDLFKQLFYSAPFAWMSIFTAFGVGVALIRENDRIILALRNVVLSLCHFLLPLLAGITLLFLASLPFTGLGPLWATKMASALLLSLAGVVILFVNGVVQDRTDGLPYPFAVRRFVEVSLLALPVLAGLVIHAIALRVIPYGLMPERVWGIFIAGIVSIYAAGYAGAFLLRRARWPLGLQAVNVVASIAIILVGIMAHTPLLDPLRLSARNQFNRLAQGRMRASEFDFGALGFELGSVGRRKLEDLKKLAHHPEFLEIQKQVRLVESLKSQDQWVELRKKQPRSALLASDLVVFPAETRVPDALLQAISWDLGTYAVTACARSRRCVLTNLQLDDDPESEFVLVTNPDHVELYDQVPEGDWRKHDFKIVGSFPYEKTQGDVVRDLKEGRFGPARLRYGPLRIGGKIYIIPE